MANTITSGAYCKTVADTFTGGTYALDYDTNTIRATLFDFTATRTVDTSSTTGNHSDSTPEYDTDFATGMLTATSGDYNQSLAATTLTTKTIAAGTNTAGRVDFDCDDFAWTNSSLNSDGILYHDETNVNLPLWVVLAFSGQVQSVSGTFTVTQPTNGYLQITLN